MRAAFIDTMAYVCLRLGLKARLRDVGSPDSTIDKLVRDAMLPQRPLVNNPRARDETDSHLMLRASEWLNRAVGAEGKRINVLLCVIGHNLRLLLALFRKFLSLILAAILFPSSAAKMRAA